MAARKQQVEISDLAQYLEPEQFLKTLAPSFCGLLGAHRFGIALLDRQSGYFENVSVWDREEDRQLSGTKFLAREAAASWVCKYLYPLVGQTPKDMRMYPGTFAYLLREDFCSNMILPIDLGDFGKGVFYILSRTAGTFGFSSMSIALRLHAILEPSLQARCAMVEFLEGQKVSLRSSFEEVDDDRFACESLDDVQRRHIVNVLEMTNGIVEGPRGAAEILKVLPSTLRNRMRKLGISRTK